MPYIQNALVFAIETVADLYIIVAILRFLLLAVRASPNNQIYRIIITLTNPPLSILRRFIPGLYGFDLASFVLVLGVCAAKFAALLAVSGYAVSFGPVMLLSLGETINTIIWVYIVAIVIRAILSWVAPTSYNPAVYIVNSVSEPLLDLVRRRIPSIQGLDLSPILIIIALNLAQKLVAYPIIDTARSMMF